MYRNCNFLSLLLAVLLLSGCSALEQAKPRDLGDSFALASTAVASASNVALAAYENDWIDREQASQLRVRMDQALDLVELGQNAWLDEKEVRAQSLLTRVNSVIGSINDDLAEHRRRLNETAPPLDTDPGGEN